MGIAEARRRRSRVVHFDERADTGARNGQL